VTYSHMATSHTTIGAERFHFRVRNGIGWFPLANAVRQKGNPESSVLTFVAFEYVNRLNAFINLQTIETA
jgi:hypothetical protein